MMAQSIAVSTIKNRMFLTGSMGLRSATANSRRWELGRAQHGKGSKSFEDSWPSAPRIMLDGPSKAAIGISTHALIVLAKARSFSIGFSFRA
jgi:hypothetical protein